MNYSDAMEYIHSTHKYGSVLGLERIEMLMELLGSPQEKLNIIHVAGTNGKGSTSSFISHILSSAGYKTGLFTSPYLESFCERIKIDFKDISEEELANSADAVKNAADRLVGMGYDHPTEFEIVTAIAFYYYSKKKVDFVVLEVGLGGRFDATNIIKKPLLSVITPIAMDHMDVLGDDISKIAYEKAGIIKPLVPVVVHPQSCEALEVLEKVALENGSSIKSADISRTIKSRSLSKQVFDCEVDGRRFEDVKISMIGSHQIGNAIVAINAAVELRSRYGYSISDESIYSGLEASSWPGRLEVLDSSPLVIIDGAHNAHGAKALSDFMRENLNRERTILVIGMLRDKEVKKVIGEIASLASRIICTSPESPRAMDCKELAAEIVTELGVGDSILFDSNSIEEATNHALGIADKKDAVVIAGSLYLIGKVRSLILKKGCASIDKI